MADDEPKTVVSSTTAITFGTTPVAFSAEHWINREYVAPPSNHPVYYLIGRVAAEWSRLEHALDRIIWVLSGTLPHEGACITSQLLGATARYRVINAQLNLRKAQAGFEDYPEHIETLMRKSYEPQEKRNRLIHDAWYLDAKQNAPGQFRSWPVKNPEFGIRAVDLSELEKTISEASALAESAEALFEEFKPLVGRTPRPKV